MREFSGGKLKQKGFFHSVDAKPPVQYLEMGLQTCLFSAGILKQSMRARNRVGLGLSYRPARLRKLAESIPWNLVLGSINV